MAPPTTSSVVIADVLNTNPQNFLTSQIPLEAPESKQRDASQRRLAQSIKDPVVADQSQPFSSRQYCTQVQCQSGLRAAREKKGRREAAAGDDAADGRALEIHLAYRCDGARRAAMSRDDGDARARRTDK